MPNRDTPTTIPLINGFDGEQWPVNWRFDCEGLDMIAERAAVRFFDRYPGPRNRKLFAELKSSIAIAITEAQSSIGLSGEPINQAPWVGDNRDIDPFNPEDVKAWQVRDRQAAEMLTKDESAPVFMFKMPEESK